jgi:hypothetical protein
MEASTTYQRLFEADGVEKRIQKEKQNTSNNKDNKRKHDSDKKQSGNGNGSKKTKSNGKAEGDKSKPKCENCGRIGHSDNDCWDHEKNADKRPKNWKSLKNRPVKKQKTDKNNVTFQEGMVTMSVDEFKKTLTKANAHDKRVKNKNKRTICDSSDESDQE